jgi:hypothetical protein
MTTWTTISNPSVAVGGLPSSVTVTALRDNPVAIAEQASGAPVIFAGWHPYDKVSVGDGKTGIIYDFAVNGVQANVVTPDFEDGYEYRIVCRDLSHNATTPSFRVEFANSDGTYVDNIQTSSGISNSTPVCLDVITLAPRVAAVVMPVLLAGTNIDMAYDTVSMGGSKILRARLLFGSGSIDAGKIWFLRQRCYVSGS